MSRAISERIGDAGSRLNEAVASLLARATQLWQAQSLTRQFFLAALPVILAGCLLIGHWITERIKQGVAESSAASVAIYIDNVIVPLIQELGEGRTISPEKQALLDRQLAPLIGKSITAIKIWRLDSSIAYSTRKSIIDRRFAPTEKFLTARGGRVAAELEGAPHEGEQGNGGYQLEVYAPVYAQNADRVIAVAEVYAIRNELAAELRQAAIAGWLTVASIASAMLLSLSMIVRRGSQTIEHQDRQLRAHLGELEGLLAQNRQLSESLERARQRSAALNEQMLRRIGADLHDGPAQLIGLSLMLLDSTGTMARKPTPAVERMRTAMRDALREIRAISGGLVMPEIASSTVNEIAAQAVRTHQQRTGSSVEMELAAPLADVPTALKVCIFRLLQEGLNNAFRHGQGEQQRIEVAADGALISVKVSDQGPGLSVTTNRSSFEGLGLAGIRDRIETIGGRIEFASPGRGFEVRATFDLDAVRRLVPPLAGEHGTSDNDRQAREGGDR